MKKISAILLLLTLSFEVSASEQIVADDIWTAVEKVEQLAKKHGPEHVLFVSDLDNTLLKTKQDLGSEPWFNWQEGLLLADSKDERRIACDFPDLLHFFHVAITLSQSAPVQADQAEAISKMQSLKVATIALTARGPEIASGTFRELSKNKIYFSKMSLAGAGDAETHVPFDLAKLSESGLTEADVAKFKLTKPRPALYQKGVFFSDGQNKGVMLRTLIHKTKRTIKGIVFFDNDEKNTKRIAEAYEDLEVEVSSIRASRMDAEIKKFNDSDKARVTREFVLLRRLLDDAYVYPRPCALPIDKKVTTPN